MMNCPICQIRKLRLLFEAFTQGHSATGLELKSSDPKPSTFSSGISVWLLRQIQSLQNKTRQNECHRAFEDGKNYSEQEGRIYLEGDNLLVWQIQWRGILS